MASGNSPAGIDPKTFGSILDHAGLGLSDAQKAVLFEAYPMFQAMVVRATAPMPREAEPSVIFVPDAQ